MMMMALSSPHAPVAARRIRCRQRHGVVTAMTSESLLLAALAVLLVGLPTMSLAAPFSATDSFAPNCTLPALPLSPDNLSSGGESIMMWSDAMIRSSPFEEVLALVVLRVTFQVTHPMSHAPVTCAMHGDVFVAYKLCLY